MSIPLLRVSEERVVRLAYDTKVDPDYLQRGVVVRYVRLLGLVSFETRDGWTKTETAIIDTGGPISIIPRRVWQQIRYGLYSNVEVEIPVGGRPAMGRFGQVTLRFHDAEDGERISPPLAIKADLLSDDTYPIILGFEDFLTDVALYSNFPTQEAYLAFPPFSSE
ncbi:hypothetical protein HYR99_28585 [Candidatus Poribacteria bacterium]|nr:hypothetical protein [Candidatus Poribacteria bacterium]